jgi:hypothetical protein
MKQDQRGLGLLAIGRPAERRLTVSKVVRLTRIVPQDFPETIVHAISGGSADIGPGSGVEQDLDEMIAFQLETIMQRDTAIHIAGVSVGSAFNEKVGLNSGF